MNEVNDHRADIAALDPDIAVLYPDIAALYPCRSRSRPPSFPLSVHVIPAKAGIQTIAAKFATRNQA